MAPKRMARGSCADDRAGISCDLEMVTHDLVAGKKIEAPTLIVWGTQSHTGKVHGDVLAIWRRYARHVEGGPIDCGHCVQEQAPRKTLEWLMNFFHPTKP